MQIFPWQEVQPQEMLRSYIPASKQEPENMLSRVKFAIYLYASSLLCKKYPCTVGASFLEDRRLGGISGFEMKKQSEKHLATHYPADYLKNKNGPGKKPKISVLN